MPSQFPSNNVSGDLKVTGKITAGSGAVDIISSAGKIPALSSTYLADLDGSNLTGVSGGKANYVAKTSDATLTTGEIGDQGFVAVTTTGGAVTITLFTASGNAGVQITIIKANAGANAVTIDGHSSETVEGIASTLLYGQSDYITIVSDGTNWRRKSEYVNIHCHVGLGSNQSIATGTWTKILFATELKDTAGAFASNKFTAPRKGVYHGVLVTYPLASLGTANDSYVMFYKNGSVANVGYTHTSDPGVLTMETVQMLQLDKDDYLEGYIYQSSGGAVNIAGHADLYYTRMEITYIGSGE